MGTRVVRRQRSPWLAPIEAAVDGAPPDRVAGAALDRLANARDKLARTSPSPTPTSTRRCSTHSSSGDATWRACRGSPRT